MTRGDAFLACNIVLDIESDDALTASCSGTLHDREDGRYPTGVI